MSVKGFKASKEALVADEALRDNYRAVADRIAASGEAGSDGELVVKTASKPSSAMRRRPNGIASATSAR